MKNSKLKNSIEKNDKNLIWKLGIICKFIVIGTIVSRNVQSYRRRL